MTNIVLKCLSPKRLAGEYTFKSFKALYTWVLENLKRPKGLANMLVLAVAENGEYKSYVQGRCIEVASDVKLGYEAKKLAREIGLIRGDRYSRKMEVGLKFAEAVDKILRSP
jgi:hypothetical protein